MVGFAHLAKAPDLRWLSVRNFCKSCSFSWKPAANSAG